MNKQERVCLALFLSGAVLAMSSGIPGFELTGRAQAVAFFMLVFLNLNELLKK